MGTYQLSGLLSVAEGEGDLGSDICGPSLVVQGVDQQVDENVVVLQQSHPAVLVVKGDVGLQGADVGVDLTGIAGNISL